MEFYDFPFSWECHHPNRRTPSHQPVKILLNLTCKLQNPAVPLQWIYYDIFGDIYLVEYGELIPDADQPSKPLVVFPSEAPVVVLQQR